MKSREIVVFIIAFIISFVLWVYANLSQNPEIIKSIAITPQYKNIPKGYQIDYLKNKITVYISGKRINIIKAIDTGINLYSVFFDLSNIKNGDNYIKPEIKELLSLGFKVINTVPSVQKIVAYKEVEKEFIVSNTVSGKPKQGFYVNNQTVSPSIVKVRGIQNDIESIYRIESNKNIDVNNVSEKMVIPLKLFAFNDKGEIVKNVKINPPTAISKIDILKYVSRNIPLIINLKGKIKKGYELYQKYVIPENIKIFGPKKSVSQIKQFIVKVPVDNVSSDIELEKKLISSSNDNYFFKNYKRETTVKIILKVRERRLQKKFYKIPISSIFNQKKDFFYRIDAPQFVDIRISGPELLLEQVFSSEVIPYVNVEKCNVGDWTLTVETMLPKGVKLVRLYPNSAKVTIVKNKKERDK